MSSTFPPSDPHLVAVFRRCAGAAAVFVAAVGVLVLAAWAFDIAPIKALQPGQVSIKPLTALALLLAGVALWLLRHPAAAGRPPSWQRRLGLISAGVVAALGGLILLEYLLGVNLGLDQALFRQAVLAENIAWPGRPPPATAACLLLLGLALLALAADPAPARPALGWLAPAATLAALLVAGLALLGYIYEETSLFQIGPYVPIAPGTALALAALALGVLAARPDGPLVRTLTTPLAGGALSRRLLPAAVLLPFVLGWLRLLGQRQAVFDLGFGGALFAVGNIVVFSGLVYWTARLLNQADARREAIHAALRESEENLRLLLDGVQDHAIFMLDPGGCVATWNATAERLTGYSAAEIVGQPVAVFYPPAAAAAGAPQRALAAALALGSAEDEGPRVRKDGSQFWATVETAPLRAEGGGLRGYALVTRDISERKRAETALRQAEERFEKAFRASPAALTVTRLADGLFVDVNDRFLALLGYTRAEVIGQTATQLGVYLNPADRAAGVQHLQAGGLVRNQEITMLTKTGERRSMVFSIDVIELGGEAHVLAILIDDTERQQAAEALLRLNAELEMRVAQRTAEMTANEAKLRALFEVLPVGVSILDAQRRIVQSNPALSRIMRLSDERLAAGAYAGRQFVRPDGSPMPAQEFASTRAFEAQRPALNVVTGVVTGSGETLWLDVSAAPLPMKDSGVVVVSADITERKRFESALIESEQRQRASFEAAQRQAQELTLRDRMHKALARELPLPEIVRLAVDGIAETLGYTLVSLYLLEGDQLQLQHQVGYDQVIATVPITAGVSGRVVRTRQPVLLEDVRSDPAFLGAIEGINSEICVPLFDQGQVAGVLNLESTHGRRLTEADLQLMLTLGEQVDFALGRARLAAQARESQQRFASAFNYAAIGMALVAPDGRFLQVNPALCRLVGYAEDKLLALDFQTITHPADLETDLDYVRRMLAGAIPTYQMEKRYFHKLGHIVWVLLSVSLVRDARGQPLYFISQIEDINERKAAEQALAHERDLMQALMDNIPDTIYFKDTGSRFTRINRAQAQYLGLPSAEAALGKTDLDFQEPALAREIFDEEQRQVLQGQPLLNRIDAFTAPDGSRHWISSTKVPLRDGGGQVVGLVGISRDITAIKQAEARLLASLQEKDVLLKEIHHRVKNNLQVVSSLLRLQAENLADPNLRDAFEDSQRRVRAMALVHEQLYRSADLAHIDFAEYLTGLVSYLRRSHARPAHALRVRVDVAHVILEIDRAVPLGLLVNELVTNSLKYAFPSAPPEAEIWVSAARDEAGTLTLVVGDNGVGLPGALDLEQPLSMGWQLVQSFVTQLHGHFTLQRQPGAVFTLTLPERKNPRG